MSLKIFNTYKQPGAYGTITITEVPATAFPTNNLTIAVVGESAETIYFPKASVVRGSSSDVSNTIINENVSSQITNSNRNIIVVDKKPIVDPNNPKVITNDPEHVEVFQDGVKIVVLSLNGTTGTITTGQFLDPGKYITVNYSYTRNPTLVSDEKLYPYEYLTKDGPNPDYTVFKVNNHYITDSYPGNITVSKNFLSLKDSSFDDMSSDLIDQVIGDEGKIIVKGHIEDFIYVTYYTNNMINSFDYLPDANIASIKKVYNATNVEYILGTDFYLSGDKINWGTGALINSGRTSPFFEKFDEVKTAVQLKDYYIYNQKYSFVDGITGDIKLIESGTSFYLYQITLKNIAVDGSGKAIINSDPANVKLMFGASLGSSVELTNKNVTYDIAKGYVVTFSRPTAITMSDSLFVSYYTSEFFFSTEDIYKYTYTLVCTKSGNNIETDAIDYGKFKAIDINGNDVLYTDITPSNGTYSIADPDFNNTIVWSTINTGIKLYDTTVEFQDTVDPTKKVKGVMEPNGNIVFFFSAPTTYSIYYVKSGTAVDQTAILNPEVSYRIAQNLTLDTTIISKVGVTLLTPSAYDFDVNDYFYFPVKIAELPCSTQYYSNIFTAAKVRVIDTVAINTNDTCVVSIGTTTSNGNIIGTEPEPGEVYYIDYYVSKTEEDYKAKNLNINDLNAVINEYGSFGPDNKITLAAFIARNFGFGNIIVKQVRKTTNEQEKIANYLDALDELSDEFYDGTNPTPIKIKSVIPLWAHPGIYGAYISNCYTMAQEVFSNPRVTWIGFPVGTTVAQAKNIAASYNRDRARFVYPDGVILDIEDTRMTMDGSIIALTLAAATLSPTRRDIAPWARQSVELPGAIGGVRLIKTTEQEDLLNSNICALKIIGSTMKIMDLVTASTVQNPNYTQVNIVTMIDNVFYELLSIVDQFVGLDQSFGDVAVGLGNSISQYLISQEKLGRITRGSNPVITQDPTNPLLGYVEVDILPRYSPLWFKLRLSVSTN